MKKKIDFTIKNLFSINKKICVVTGASGSIGKEISKLLKLNGAIVIRIDKTGKDNLKKITLKLIFLT